MCHCKNKKHKKIVFEMRVMIELNIDVHEKVLLWIYPAVVRIDILADYKVIVIVAANAIACFPD